MTLILTVIVVALIFEYINGFHDTANSIATVVSTKVLTPRQAVVLAAITNLAGAMWGTAVAQTIAAGLVDTKVITSEVLICALFGAIVWNLITWRFGMPSSSSHALVGGLCGGALAAAHNRWGVIVWSVPAGGHWWLGKGVLWKVIVPMFTSPACGLVIGFLVMGLAFACLALALGASRLERVTRWVYLVSSALIVAAFVGMSWYFSLRIEYRFEVTAIFLGWLSLMVSGSLLAVVFRRSAHLR